MDIEKLIAEIEAIINKYKGEDAPQAGSEEEQKDMERMAELTAELERRRANGEAEQSRAAAIDAARRAIDSGAATRIDAVPLARSANFAAPAGGTALDTTDYKAAERRAYIKDLATRSGVTLSEGNDLTEVEQRAFTALTSNTDAVVPVELQNEIISLIEGSAVLFNDVRRTTLKNQFELVRHVGIKAGDAAVTSEGVAAEDEENQFTVITITGEEIKKTVKMSRKMAVQSMDGFEAYIKQETADRLSVAADKLILARLVSDDLGMDAANKVSAKTAGKLVKADLTGALAKLKNFGNSAPKGIVIYANNSTIWNHIAMVEGTDGHSLFVDEKSEDPTIQGRIFGKHVKEYDNLADGVILLGFPDLFRGNVFDGPNVYPYVENGTRKSCFDGYMLFDGGLAVPHGFAQLTIGTATK